MLPHAGERAGEPPLGRHDRRHRGEPLLAPLEAVGRFVERGGEQVGPADHREEVHADPVGAAREQALRRRRGARAGGTADAGLAHFRRERIEVGEEADLFVAAREGLEGIAQVVHAAVQLPQLGGELAVLVLEALGAGEVDGAGDAGVAEQQRQADSNHRQARDHLQNGVRDFDDARRLGIMRDQYQRPPTAFCHVHTLAREGAMNAPSGSPHGHGVAGIQVKKIALESPVVKNRACALTHLESTQSAELVRNVA